MYNQISNLIVNNKSKMVYEHFVGADKMSKRINNVIVKIEDFKLAESREFKNDSANQSFTMSTYRWISMTNVKGFISKRGNYSLIQVAKDAEVKILIDFITQDIGDYITEKQPMILLKEKVLILL